MANKAKTRKTAVKRVKLSKPKGGRKAKVQVKARKHHMITKRISRKRTRKESKQILKESDAKRFCAVLN